MASTRMKGFTSYQVYHREAASGDMAQHEVSTTDSLAQNLSGNFDLELEADATVVHVDASKVQDASEGTIGTAAIADYIYIKNTGFTSSAKSATTTSDLTVGIGGVFASGGFTLSSGEAITLHGLGGGSDNLNEIQLDSSSGDIYVEIVYL